MPEPVEIKLTLDKAAFAKDLSRIKEKMKAGQAPTSPGSLPGIVKPDTGRAAEVDRALERERDERIFSGGGEAAFLQGGIVAAGRRALLGAAEGGAFGSFAAGATRFSGGVAATGGVVLTAAILAKAMAESVVQIAPVIVGIVSDYLKDEFPWLYDLVGQDAEEFTAWVTGKVNQALAKIDSLAALKEAADVEFARARTGQELQFGSDFAKLQKIRENESALKRKAEAESLERGGREIAKQMLRGAR